MDTATAPARSALSAGILLGVVALLVTSCAPATERDDVSTTSSTATVDAEDAPAPDDGSTPGTAAQPAGTTRAEVVEVVDGDTLRVRLDTGEVERVRLVGINTPERGECFFHEATGALADLVAGEPVGLERDTSDRDTYGRLLRYLWAGDRLVNEVLVREGYALARRYPPDTSRARQLEAAEQAARDAGAGRWGTDGCVAAGESTLELTVQADPPGDDTEHLVDEWVAIRNTGTAPVELAGWTLRDESASHRYVFAEGVRVVPGGTLRVRTGCGQDDAENRYWCMEGSAVWNNGGDTAFLLDEDGRMVVMHSW